MKKLQFPENFLWGTATSAHQVEGGNKNNDWWAWENSKKRIENLKKQGKNPQDYISGSACNHYNLYKQDFDLIEKLNNNIHRFSIEWSRIEPECGKFNQKEIDHYKNVLLELKNKNIKTMVTLHHFTNPIWFSKIGGFKIKKAADYFARYTEVIAKNLGKYIDFWITINEPEVYVSLSYLKGYWPPQAKSLISTVKVSQNLIKAHQKAYLRIHQLFPKSKVGIAKNNAFIEPEKNNFLNNLLVFTLRYFNNFYFLDKIKNYQDFIGLNYYFHRKLTLNLKLKNENKEVSDLGWEIYPEGIYKVLIELKKYNLPIYITENGLADAKDKLRGKFILTHLKEVYNAIKDGVDVRGYLHWSLLDNFEWAEGFSPRFGLVNIDYVTQKRTLRKSALLYSEICQENGITESIIKKYQSELIKTIF